MKKLFFSLLVLFAITANVNAQVTNEPNPMAQTPANQPENNAYWYYPQQNVYYNDVAKSYWYWDKTSSTWMKAVELATPYTPVTDTDTRYKITYDGNDIWKDNTDHKNKYKVQKSTPKNKMKSSGS
jgi:hypothetical protein